MADETLTHGQQKPRKWMDQGDGSWAPQVEVANAADIGGGGGLTDAELRASPVPVSGTVSVNEPVTVDGTVTIQDGGGSITVDGTVTVSEPVSVDDNGASLTVDSAQLPAALDADGGMKVHIQNASAGGGGTEYTEGDTDASITGTAVLWEDASDTLRAVSAAKPLPVAQQGNVNVGNFPAVQPVSDNGGSLTVDGTVALDAASLSALETITVGTALPTGGNNIGDVDILTLPDTATREVGRTRIWDGTDEATVLPVRTQPANTEKGAVTIDIPFRMPSYGCTTIAIAPAIAVGVKELLAVWHAAAGTKDIYIVEITATGLVTTASTAGRSALRVSMITAAPTGGTEEAKADLTGAGASDMTNAMRVKTGGGTIGSTFVRRHVWGATQAVNSRVEVPLFKVDDVRKAIILRQGSNSGVSIDIEREVAHTALVDQWTVNVLWLEL